MILDPIVVFCLRHRIRGGGRLRRIVGPARRLNVVTKHGIKLMVDPDEGLDTSIIVNGFYEEEVYAAVAEHLKQGDVFWDVGANLGLHALTVKKHFPGVEVFAFEPNPSMLELLHESARKNDLSIQIVPTALDEKNGGSQFFVHPGNTGRCGLHNWNEDPNLPRITVNTACGDTLIEQAVVKPPNVMKIDVEGHERAALEGLRLVLEKGPLRVIVFEDLIDDDRGVKSLLTQHGFTIMPLDRTDSDNPALKNYLAIRSGS